MCAAYIYMISMDHPYIYTPYPVTGFGKTCIVHTSDFAHSKVHNT